MLTEGMTLPNASLLEMKKDGSQPVSLADKLKARRVVIFAVPGAFTPTCDSAHLPSFIRTADAFRQKGVDEIICLSVNDAYVMGLWDKQSGATDAGITMLADAGAEFTQAVGMAYSSPKSGLLNRSKRYALYAEDGVVKVYHAETGTGTCEISGGEALLAAI